MNCQERQDQLLLLAFDQLEAEQERELREHLAGGCPVCAGALAESRAIAGMMPMTLRSVLPDPQVKDRVMSRVQQEQIEDRPPMRMVQPEARQANWFRPMAIAALVAIAVTGFLAYEGPVRHLQAKNVALNNELGEAKSKADQAEGRAKTAEGDAETARADAKSANARASDAMTQISQVQQQTAQAEQRASASKTQLVAAQADLDKTKQELAAAHDDGSTTHTRLASLEQQLKDEDARIKTLNDDIQNAQVDEQFIKAPSLQLVNLHSPTQPAASGHILWDENSNRWLMVANGLKAPAPGKTYELWIITDQPEPVRAGTFDVNAKGESTLLVNLPAGAHITKAAVTDEPAGGVNKPTGQMQFIGEVHHG